MINDNQYNDFYKNNCNIKYLDPKKFTISENIIDKYNNYV